MEGVRAGTHGGTLQGNSQIRRRGIRRGKLRVNQDDFICKVSQVMSVL